MSTPSWPLSRRAAGLPPDDTLHENIPPWLDRPLASWVTRCREIVSGPTPDYGYGETRARNWEDRIFMRARVPTGSLTQRTDEERLDIIDAMLAVTAELTDDHGQPFGDDEAGADLSISSMPFWPRAGRPGGSTSTAGTSNGGSTRR